MPDDDTKRPPPELLEGRRAIEGLHGVSLLGDFVWSEIDHRWVLSCRLTIESADERLILHATDWYILIATSYPWGSIKFHPAKVGNIVRTFPHQRHNAEGDSRLLWRTGDLCLDTIAHGLVRHGAEDEPYDPPLRLRWHCERALDWLRAAAQGTLAKAGDPFELPHYPHSNSGRIVAFSENDGSFASWQAVASVSGVVQLFSLSGRRKITAVDRFLDLRDRESLQVQWGPGFMPESSTRMTGIWLRLDGPPVLSPWHAPTNWGELTEAVGQQGKHLLELLRPLVSGIRDGRSHFLLLGFPIPELIGGKPQSMYWQALDLPVLSNGQDFANGFRPNEQGYWIRDKREMFRSSEPICWVQSENWHSDQLSTRGRLPASVSKATVAVIGIGAIGSCMSELLIRGGVQKLIVVDCDLVTAGNLVRHTLLIENIGDLKARSVAERLKRASPHAVVESMDCSISSLSREEWANLEGCDLLIDCTGSDEVLYHLAVQRCAAERVYCSVSIGFGARRLFVFIAHGSAFPHEGFRQVIQPWLERGRQEFNGQSHPWAGIGCWHPVFPARADDMWLLTSLALKSIESTLGISPLRAQLAVFEIESDGSEFIVVRLVAREFTHA